MIYSPHTFEITLKLDTNEFGKLLGKAYEKAKDKHRLYRKKKDTIYHDDAFLKHGIKIEYDDGIYKKRIKFIVNSTKLLGGNDIKKLWKPKEDNISKVLQELNDHIDDYFDSKYTLNDFKLTRIDFTVNIDVKNEKNVSDYIKVLHNIGKVKFFAPKYSRNDSQINKDLSFDLEGNSNGIEFSAYDKEAESNQKEAKGILRVEVRLKKQETICKYTDKDITSKQFQSLALDSKRIFLSIFSRIVPFGDYYKKKKAEKIINENIHKKKQREKMLRLIELIPKKKSLYLALKEMKERDIDKVMIMFAELNLSPVTISKSHKLNSLISLYSYLS